MSGWRGKTKTSKRNRHLKVVGPSKYFETLWILPGPKEVFPCYRVSITNILILII